MSLEDTSNNKFFTQLHLVHQFVLEIPDQSEVIQRSDKLRVVEKDKETKYNEETKQGDTFQQLKTRKYFNISSKKVSQKLKYFN